MRRTARQALFSGDLSRTTRHPFISRTARVGQSRSHAAHNLCARGNVCRSKQLGCIPLMEPTMISLRVLSTVAAIALILPMAVPTASFAQNQPPGKAGAAAGAPHIGGGGGGAPRMGGGGAPRLMGSGGGGGGVRMGGGAPPMGAAPGPRVSGGGGVAMGGGAPGPRFSGGGGGGGYRGGYDGGRRHDHGGGGLFPGAVAGALVGGAIASQGYYGPGYSPGYYDDQYYDDSAVAVAPAGDDGVAYCMQTYRSYDPQSGTYLGNDGYRHPCP